MTVVKYCVIISTIDFVLIAMMLIRLRQPITVNIDQVYASHGFRIDAFMNSTVMEMELKFGKHFAEEMQDDDKRRGAIWWPSWSPQAGKVSSLKENQIAELRLYSDNDRTAYIWYVRDSNDLWKVVKDITPPSGWVE